MTHTYSITDNLLRASMFALPLWLFSSAAAWGQTLSGTYYVGTSASPNASRTYATLPAAMTALGTNGG